MVIERVSTEWWNKPDQVAALTRFLVDRGRLDPTDIDALCAFLAAPWKRQADREEMLARRTANDSDGTSHIRRVC